MDDQSNFPLPAIMASFLDNEKPWRRHVVICCSGAVASLALPPLGFWPVLFVTFPFLLLVLDGISLKPLSPGQEFKSAFFAGWLFGFGYFVTSLYWIGAALLVEPDKFALLLPLAVIALPAGLALFWGLATGLSILLWKMTANRLVTLTLALTLFEWLRGYLFTGFPWNTIGYSSASLKGLDQLAAFSGIYGVTLMILIWSFTPVLFFAKRINYLLIGCLVLSFSGTWFLGHLRSAQSHILSTTDKSSSQPIIRVVQPNIMQEKKWDRAYRQENIDRYFQISAQKSTGLNPGKQSYNILVWPESALPLIYEKSEKTQLRVASLLPKNTLLLMGALRLGRGIGRGQDSNTQTRPFFNSLLAVNSEGKVIATYDKSHLVPFGEYLPAEKWLAPLGLRKIVALPASFSSGNGPKTIKINTFPSFSAFICYEISFSDKIAGRNPRPEWIVNVTNDGWFGKTAGPHQHLAQTRFRAIEQGLPIVRAANTGISAMIDPYGAIVDFLPLGQAGFFDTRLPKALPKTIFVRFGYLPLIVQVVLILLVFATFSKLVFRRNRSPKADSSDK